MADNDSSIPIVDFKDFGDGTSQRAHEIGRDFYAACRDVGFAYIVNHVMPQAKIDEMFTWSKRFFDLPSEVKLKAPHPPRGDWHRGYSGVGVEQISQMIFDQGELAKARRTVPDFKESFDMGIDERRHKNIWVAEEALPGFRAYCEDFMQLGRELQGATLKALAIGMGVPIDFFDPFHSEANNQVRLLHYPSAPASTFTNGEKGRIAAHTDFGTCTFLFQDDCGGLEVESPTQPGMFIPAPPISGAVIFNIADYLARWSNDSLKSTLHRVRAPPARSEDGGWTRERYSIPYFCCADRDKIIDALPGTWSESRPKLYPPITAGEYLDKRLNASYA